MDPDGVSRYHQVMAAQPAAMHVARIRSSYAGRSGERREYESAYLRRTFRDGGTVKHQTLANLSGLPDPGGDAIGAALRGTPLGPAGPPRGIARPGPHGHGAPG